MTDAKQRLAASIAGLTRTQAAFRLGVSKRHLNRLLDGSRAITDDVAERVHERLAYDGLRPAADRYRPWSVVELAKAKKANATKAGYEPDIGGWTAS